MVNGHGQASCKLQLAAACSATTTSRAACSILFLDCPFATDSPESPCYNADCIRFSNGSTEHQAACEESMFSYCSNHTEELTACNLYAGCPYAVGFAGSDSPCTDANCYANLTVVSEGCLGHMADYCNNLELDDFACGSCFFNDVMSTASPCLSSVCFENYTQGAMSPECVAVIETYCAASDNPACPSDLCVFSDKFSEASPCTSPDCNGFQDPFIAADCVAEMTSFCNRNPDDLGCQCNFKTNSAFSPCDSCATRNDYDSKCCTDAGYHCAVSPHDRGCKDIQYYEECRPSEFLCVCTFCEFLHLLLF